MRKLFSVERRSAQVGSNFDQHCSRLKANGGPPPVEEEVSRALSIVEVSCTCNPFAYALVNLSRFYYVGVKFE